MRQTSKFIILFLINFTSAHASLRCPLQEDFRLGTVAFFARERFETFGRWLPSRFFPIPGKRLQSQAEWHERSQDSSQCAQEAKTVLSLINAYTLLASAIPTWNTTEIRWGNALALRLAAEDFFGVFAHYLDYQTKKAELVSSPTISNHLLEGWPLEEAIVVFGRLLRSGLLQLRFSAQDRTVQGHCACRLDPEIQSLVFDKFDELRENGAKAISPFLFQCGGLELEPNYGDFNEVFAFARQTSTVSCAPADAVIRAACAQFSLETGGNQTAYHLMQAVGHLMFLSADCFEQTPWTTGPESLSASEVWLNWANFARGYGTPWFRSPASLPLRRSVRASRFFRDLCSVSLGPGYVDIANGEVVIQSHSQQWRGTQEAYLSQCGDSYGEWRRIQVVNFGGNLCRFLGKPAIRERKGWILHVTPIALRNLWHLLHILLPAFSRHVGTETVDRLIIAGLAQGESDKIRSGFAWPFLRVLSEKEPLIMGGQSYPTQKYCFDEVFWGHDAMTLFGRDKGGPGVIALRNGLQRVVRVFSTRTRLSNVVPAEKYYSFGGFKNARELGDDPMQFQVPWRVLHTTRRLANSRQVANELEIENLLKSYVRKGRARVANIDFAEKGLVGDVVTQWKLSSMADVLVGPHGAGLAWAAFMAPGRILVELMPYMQALNSQLCRQNPSGSRWDQNSMYAYGGLSAAVGVRHVCVLGLPGAGSPSSSGLIVELNSWTSLSIVVDVEVLHAEFQSIFDHLDDMRNQGAICPLEFEDEFLCPVRPVLN